MKKRLLALLLVIAMVLGMLPMTAFAATAGETVKYTFSSITGSVQYAEETHKLDDTVSLYINKCHINTQLRIYSSTTNNGVAIFKSTLPMSAILLNAGNKADTLLIAGSNDEGATWTDLGSVTVVSSYKDYTFDFSGEYTWLKLDVEGSNQVRLPYVSITFAAASSGDSTCEHANTTTTTKDATCTENGSVTITCNDCGATVDSQVISAAGHNYGEYAASGKGYNVKTCSVCQAEYIEPDSTLPLDVAAAWGIAGVSSDKYYVKGEITEVYNTTYGNMYITDGTNTLTIYGTYDADGTNRYDAMENQPVAGDTVTLYGVLGSYNGTAQMQYAWITEIEVGCEHTNTSNVAGTAADCTTAGSADAVVCNDCGKTISGGEETPALGHTDENADGICDVCKKEVALTTGQYVLSIKDGTILGKVDGTWITAGDATSVWTLTVTGETATLCDVNGVYIAPKGGNSNGLGTSEYSWSVADNGDGTFSFYGQGEDTVVLAYNSSSDYMKFRVYKTTTVEGSPDAYPCAFTLNRIEAECEHNYVGVETTAATLNSSGLMTYTCSECGDSYTEEIAQLTGAEAAIDGWNYATLEEAIAAWGEGETLTLLAAVTTSEPITITESKTLDGNGNTLTYTGSNRAIEIPNEAGAAEVVISGLTVVCSASYCERGINYNAAGSLLLDGVSVSGASYAVNVPGKANGAEITIDSCALSGNIALNVWGTECSIEVADSDLTSVDNNAEEGYTAVKLNNDGTTSAEGTEIVIYGGTITALNENGDLSVAVSNSTETGSITVSDETVVTGYTTDPVAVINYGTNSYTFYTLQAAVDKAVDGETVILLTDIELTESIKVTGDVTVDLNGKKLTGPDDGNGNYYAFIVDGGNLTLKDSVGTGELWAKCYGVETKSGSFTMESGKITATNNATLGSAVVNYGGTVTINGGELSGALNSVCTGGFFAVAETVINGGTLTGPVAISDYNTKGCTIKSAANTYETVENYKWLKKDGLYVLTEATLPEATVSVMDPVVLMAGEYDVWTGSLSKGTENLDLPVVMKFKANESAEDIAGTYYEKWLVDFYITIDGLANGSITGDDCYLAGNYGTFGWIAVPTDGVELEAGVEYPVVAAYDPTLNYKDICGSVKEFIAAIHISDEILENNPNLTVTLRLKMTNPENSEDVLEIGEGYTYTNAQLSVKPVAEVNGAQYYTFAEAEAVAVEGDTITLLQSIVIDEDTTLDLTGKKLDGNGVYPAFRVVNGATLTVEGGEFTNTDYLFVLGASDGSSAGNLNINGGTFHAQTTVASVTKGALTVNGGEFSVTPYEGSYAYLLNCIDANYKDGSATITVNGGSFENWDPAANAAEGANTDFVTAEGYFTTEVSEGVYAVYPALPEATINDMGEVTLTEYNIYTGSLTAGTEPLDLAVALQFLTQDTEEEAAASFYADFITDFYITIDGLANGSIDGTGCYLAGNYGSFGWIVIPLDGMTIEGGVVYPVLNSVDMPFTYEAICTDVKDFKCGIYFTDEILAANPDITVNLTLGLSETEEKADAAAFYAVDEQEYAVEELCQHNTTECADNYDGETHNVVCAICEVVITENVDHSYDENGECACGVYELGSEMNPIPLYPMMLQNGYTVTVPAGKTVYYIVYQAYGADITVDGEVIGSVTAMSFPFNLTNEGTEAADHVIGMQYPVGSQMNPAELSTEMANYFVAGSDYYYNWTAPADGTLTISVYAEDADWQPLGWFYVVNNMTTYAYGDQHYSNDDPVVEQEVITVKAGDVIEVVANTYDPEDMWNAPAGDMYVYASFVCDVHGNVVAEYDYDEAQHALVCETCGTNVGYEAHEFVNGICACGFEKPGTETNPIAIYGDYTATIAAGETVYFCAYYQGGNEMTINGGNAVTVTSYAYNFSITNEGAEEAVYEIKFIQPVGTYGNPEVIESLPYEDTNSLVEDGSYYYIWTATEDATVILDITDGANITVDKMTYTADSEWPITTQYTLAEAEVDENWNYTGWIVAENLEIDVVAGEELKIQVNGLTDWSTRTAPAIDYTLNVSVKSEACAEHTDNYTDNGDGTHDNVCSVCGTVIADNEAHTYVDGVCVCGAEEPVVDTGISGSVDIAKGQKITPAATWTAPADGYVTFTMTTSAATGNSYQLLANGVRADGEEGTGYLDFVGTVTETYPVVAGDEYVLNLWSWHWGNFANNAATIDYSFTFSTEAGEVEEPKKKYIISDLVITEEGTHDVAMIENAEMTVVTVTPNETGYYNIAVIGDAQIANVGGSSAYIFSWDSVTPGTAFDWTCAEIAGQEIVDDNGAIYYSQGQSVMVGIVGDVEKVQIVLTKTAEYVDEEDEIVVYENKAALSEFAIPEGATLGEYVDVSAAHTAVLGDDGYYHLDSADGPILLVDMNYQNIVLTDVLKSDRPVMYAYVENEDGTTTKYDIGAAVQEYEAVMDADGYYPLTEDLILFYEIYATGAGIWSYNQVEGESAWMYCMRTMTLADPHECEYVYTDNGDGTHTAACECGEILVENEAHSYPTVTDGTESVKCAHCESMSVAYFSAGLDLGTSLAFKFFIPVAANDALWSTYAQGEGNYMLIEMDNANGETDAYRYDQSNVNEWKPAGAILATVDFTGATANRMTDEFRVTMYNAAGYPISATFVNTMEDVILDMFDKATDENAKYVCVDLLNYGAAAQMALDYKEDDLANANLTDAHKQYVTPAQSQANQQVIEGAAPFSLGVDLANRLTLTMFYNNVPTAAKIKISFTNFRGETKNSEITELNWLANGAVLRVDVAEMVIPDCEQIITIEILDAEGNTLSKVVDSIGYAADRYEGEEPIYDAIMKLSYSARKYFGY